MRAKIRRALVIVLLGLIVALAVTAPPYLRAAGLVIRAAHTGGRFETLARATARAVQIAPPTTFPSRYGDVPVQIYVPAGAARRTALLLPGIHSMGIHEPRLVALAQELAGSGVRVVTVALPDLTTYEITPHATDVIEDAVQWAAGHREWATDGRVGVIGISFAGGLAIVAAGDAPVRDRIAFVVSFGGHGDLPRVMHYLATGEAPAVPRVRAVRPHDYGLTVLLYGVAATGLVPPNQVEPLREAIRTYLLASQLTLVDTAQAEATFARARTMGAALPAPASRYMTEVNARDVKALGPAVLPFLNNLGQDARLSPVRSPTPPPSTPIFLIHGDEDSVIPTAESVLLAEGLRQQGANVRLLISGLITHAEVNRSGAMGEMWRLVTFWADVLRR